MKFIATKRKLLLIIVGVNKKYKYIDRYIL